jgi:hypothetical protein
MMRSYTSRLSEVEEEIASIEAGEALRKTRKEGSKENSMLKEIDEIEKKNLEKSEGENILDRVNAKKLGSKRKK